MNPQVRCLYAAVAWWCPAARATLVAAPLDTDRGAGEDDVRRITGAQVAASSTWVDPEGVRRPAGDVHAWEPGTNQTVCGLALSRSSLARFPHVAWPDVLPETGSHADAVQHVCPKCRAVFRPRRPAVDRHTFRRP